MDESIKQYGSIVVTVICAAIVILITFSTVRNMLMSYLEPDTSDIVTEDGIAVSSSYKSNKELMAELNLTWDDFPDVTVSGYRVSLGNEKFDYYGQATHKGIKYSKRDLAVNNKGLSIYIVSDNGLYLNVDSMGKEIPVDQYINSVINGTRIIDKEQALTLKYRFCNAKGMITQKTVNVIID